MKKLFIKPGCIACGTCEFIAPDVFEVKNTCRVKKNVDLAKNDDLIKKAVQLCEMGVIEYEEVDVS